LILGPGSGSSGPFFTEPRSEDAWKQAIEVFGSKPSNHKDLQNSAFVQLYNLKDDPGETRDLSESHPGRITKMLNAYQEIISRGRSTAGPKLENDRTVKAFHPPSFVWAK
ncbi:MAG: hypothetical protein P8L85_03795, partial [Rubripirellula sp.]|nr:hypothetical protein [Rubripirellula sp.]